MALPGVSIEIQNGNLGQVAPTDDSVVGMILQGVAATSLQLATAAQVFNLDEVEALGIDAAYDTTNSVDVYRTIREFYDEAGSGAELWIMLVAQALTVEQIVDIANNHAKKLLNDANGRIRVWTVGRFPAAGYTPTTTNAMDVDIENAINKAQALCEDFASRFAPCRCILPAYAYTGTVASLPDLKTRDDNRVSILLGNTKTGGNSAVGLLLGRLAAVPVQRNVGRVKDGAVEANAIYFGSSTLEAAESTSTSAHDKAFITFRRHIRKAGYFFTDDPTATAATDDYNSLARGRVIDKAIVLAYDVYVNEILDEIEIDTTTGRIALDKAKYYQTIVQNAIDTAMTANGEISGVNVFVDPAQNVLSTGQICIELRIVPVGYARQIIVKLGFYNPANA